MEHADYVEEAWGYNEETAPEGMVVSEGGDQPPVVEATSPAGPGPFAEAGLGLEASQSVGEEESTVTAEPGALEEETTVPGEPTLAPEPMETAAPDVLRDPLDGLPASEEGRVLRALTSLLLEKGVVSRDELSAWLEKL
jgi:hypothetical protein